MSAASIHKRRLYNKRIIIRRPSRKGAQNCNGGNLHMRVGVAVNWPLFQRHCWDSCCGASPLSPQDFLKAQKAIVPFERAAGGCALFKFVHGDKCFFLVEIYRRPCMQRISGSGQQCRSTSPMTPMTFFKKVLQEAELQSWGSHSPFPVHRCALFLHSKES